MRKTALVAAVLSLLLVGTACVSIPSALSFGKTTVNANMYGYFASSYKSVYASGLSGYRDTEEFWQQTVSGDTTLLSLLNREVLQNVERTLVCAELFDRFGLRLSETEKESVRQQLDRLQQDYADGDRNTFNYLLAEFFVNRDMLEEIYLMESKVDGLRAYLSEEGRELCLTEEKKETYLKENYARVRLILINDVYRFVTNEDGLYLYDTETGEYKTEPWNEQEKAEKARIISELESVLTPENFGEMETKYSEVQAYYGSTDAYPQGYYLSRFSDFLPEVLDLSFSLAEGEIGRVSTENGTFFLLRLKPEEKAYEKEENEIFFASFENRLTQQLFLEYLAPYMEEVTVREEEIALYSLDRVRPNSRF